MPSRSPRTRSELLRYGTTYEIVAELPSGAVRLGFTARPSMSTFVRLAQQHAEEILPHIAADDEASYTAAGGLRLGRDVLIRKSGRTERECADAEPRSSATPTGLSPRELATAPPSRPQRASC
jgi:hypothetical protein